MKAIYKRGSISNRRFCTNLDWRLQIEKNFEMLRDLDLFPLISRKRSTVRETIFVLSMALIPRSMIVGTMNISGLTKKCSVERMFMELEKLQITKTDKGSFEELERTKKKSDILTLLEKISWGKYEAFRFHFIASGKLCKNNPFSNL